MNNPVKVVFGSVIGAGIGMAISKVVERTDPDAQQTAQFGTAGSEQKPSLVATFRERLERAQQAGDAAKAEKEAELREYFREKVADPQAMRNNPMP